jgi:hypothetical protein
MDNIKAELNGSHTVVTSATNITNVFKEVMKNKTSRK